MMMRLVETTGVTCLEDNPIGLKESNLGFNGA
jgi:hypothetical protein